MAQTTVNNTANNEAASQTKSSPTGRQTAREVLMGCVRAVINPGKDPFNLKIIGEKMDWDYLIALSDFQNVTPMIAHVLLQNEYSRYVPETYREKLARILRDNINNHIILSGELAKVLSLLHRSEIDVIALKGNVLAEQLYVNPSLRPTSDIDILVTEEQISKVKAILPEMDYSQTTSEDESDHPFHTAYYKRNNFKVTLELHWNLNDPEIIDTPQSKLWKRAQPHISQHFTARVLSPEDNLIYLSNTLFKDFHQQLKYLCDITILLMKYRETLDWQYITKSATGLGTSNALYYALRWVEEFFGVTVPSSAMSEVKPGLARRWILGFLNNTDCLLSPVTSKKVSGEMSAIVYSLMMSRFKQSIMILYRYRGYDKNRIRALTHSVPWMVVVFGVAVNRNVLRFFQR